MKKIGKAKFLKTVFGACLLTVPTLVMGELICPPMPSAVTTISRDIKSDVNASVGTLSKLKAGELKSRTEVIAKNLFDKYPGVDRLLTVQTLSATYCAMIRDSKISDQEKLNRWEVFQDKILGIPEKRQPARGALPIPAVSDRVSVVQNQETERYEEFKKSGLLPGSRLEKDFHYLVASIHVTFGSQQDKSDPALLTSISQAEVLLPGTEGPERVLFNINASEGSVFARSSLNLKRNEAKEFALKLGSRLVSVPLSKLTWKRSPDGDYYWAAVDVRVEIFSANWPLVRHVLAVPSADKAESLLDILIENRSDRDFNLENVAIFASHPNPRANFTACYRGDPLQEVHFEWGEALSGSNDGNGSWTTISSKRVIVPSKLRVAGSCSDYQLRSIVPTIHTIEAKKSGRLLLNISEIPGVIEPIAHSPGMLDGLSQGISRSDRPSGPPRRLTDWNSVFLVVNATKSSQETFPREVKLNVFSEQSLDSQLREVSRDNK